MKSKLCDKCGRAPVWESVSICSPCHEKVLEEETAFIYITHDYYGCDSGCCGHRIYACDSKGSILMDKFSFSHPYGESHEEWARSHADSFLLDPSKLNFDRCDIHDY